MVYMLTYGRWKGYWYMGDDRQSINSTTVHDSICNIISIIYLLMYISQIILVKTRKMVEYRIHMFCGPNWKHVIFCLFYDLIHFSLIISVIHLGKIYIYRQKINKKEISFKYFLTELKLDIEKTKYVNQTTQKITFFNMKCANILEALIIYIIISHSPLHHSIFIHNHFNDISCFCPSLSVHYNSTKLCL